MQHIPQHLNKKNKDINQNEHLKSRFGPTNASSADELQSGHRRNRLETFLATDEPVQVEQ